MDVEEPTSPATRDRPSFSKFWKRTKEAVGRRKGARSDGNITFVNGGQGDNDESPPGPSGANDDSLTAKDKAQKRRQQVRRAQIQHRQRKAGYLKQLELDVATQRELIATTERECRALRTENEVIRTALMADGFIVPDVGGLSPPLGYPSAGPPPPKLGSVPEAAVTDGSPADIDQSLEDLIVGLEMDEMMGGLAWQFRDSTSPGSGSGDMGLSSAYGSSSWGPTPSVAASTPARRRDSEGQPELTPEETQQAINFILALEHICWDHFTHATTWPQPTFDPDNNGHSLMASAIVLAEAPPGVFPKVSQLSASRPHAETCPTQQLKLGSTPSKTLPPPPSIPPPSTDDLSWSASGLTLQTLKGLAASLNEPDTELTPVQAWFEMAAKWPTEVLLRREVLDELKRGLKGLVKCVHFGAVVEREAFERVSEGVLGRAMGEIVSSYNAVNAAIQ